MYPLSPLHILAAATRIHVLLLTINVYVATSVQAAEIVGMMLVSPALKVVVEKTARLASCLHCSFLMPKGAPSTNWMSSNADSKLSPS